MRFLKIAAAVLVVGGCVADTAPTSTKNGPNLSEYSCNLSGPTWGSAPILNGVRQSTGRPLLSWTDVSADSYQVFRRSPPGEPDWIAVSVRLTALSMVDAVQVIAGTGTPRYEWQVIGYTTITCPSTGASQEFPTPASNIVSFKAPSLPI